jgi:hypothetical protein
MRTHRILLALSTSALFNAAHAILSSRSKGFAEPESEPFNYAESKQLADRGAVLRRGSADRMTFELKADSEATISLSATGPVRFSSYYTPFYGEKHGQVEDMFQIFPPAKFIGVTVHYAYNFNATAIHLSRGQTKSLRLDLSLLYAFEPGTTYTVQFNHNVYFLNEQAWLPVGSNQVDISISSETKLLHDNKIAAAYLPSDAGKRLYKHNVKQSIVTTYSCSALELATIHPALKNARQKSAKLRSCYKKSSKAAHFRNLIIRWFGQAAWNTSLYNTLKSKLLAVQNALTRMSFNIVCNPSQCHNDYYAFSIPADQSHTIYLCNQFFIGTAREKTNTFAHEMSHFFNVASTYDVTYGPTNCLSLAKRAPYGAVDNADSYGYFVAATNVNTC